MHGRCRKLFHAVEVNARFGYGNVRDLGAVKSVHGGNFAVAGRFRGEQPATAQKLNKHAVKMLRARAYYYALRLDRNAAGAVQVCGNRVLKLLVAAARNAFEKVLSTVGKHGAHKLCPC